MGMDMKKMSNCFLLQFYFILKSISNEENVYISLINCEMKKKKKIKNVGKKSEFFDELGQIILLLVFFNVVWVYMTFFNGSS